MSPSIELCGHPRYASVEYNRDTKQYYQCVLQCMAMPSHVWKKERSTMQESDFGLQIDPNFSRDDIYWMFRPNHKDAAGKNYVRDSIICTGIMLRITNKHPYDMKVNWWSEKLAYMEHFKLLRERIDPNQSNARNSTWKHATGAMRYQFKLQGHVVDCNFEIATKTTKKFEDVWIAPQPFDRGSMRLAYYMRSAEDTLYVLKPYNDEMRRHIEHGLKITEEQAIRNDVKVLLVAEYFAGLFNGDLADLIKTSGQSANFNHWHVKFVTPFIFVIDGKLYFAEKFVRGGFVKWNNNSGHVVTTKNALANNSARLSKCFSHYTWHKSSKKLIIVDIQGWDVQTGMLFTDPQIHSIAKTSSIVSGVRYSLGDLGKAGMIRFFHTHDCDAGTCNFMNLKCPHWKKN